MKWLFMLLLVINLGIFIWAYQREQQGPEAPVAAGTDIGNMRLLSERKNSTDPDGFGFMSDKSQQEPALTSVIKEIKSETESTAQSEIAAVDAQAVPDSPVDTKKEEQTGSMEDASEEKPILAQGEPEPLSTEKQESNLGVKEQPGEPEGVESTEENTEEVAIAEEKAGQPVEAENEVASAEEKSEEVAVAEEKADQSVEVENEVASTEEKSKEVAVAEEKADQPVEAENEVASAEEKPEIVAVVEEKPDQPVEAEKEVASTEEKPKEAVVTEEIADQQSEAEKEASPTEQKPRKVAAVKQPPPGTTMVELKELERPVADNKLALKKPVLTSRCGNIGPLKDKKVARKIYEDLQKNKVDADLVQSIKKQKIGYWVVIPPLADGSQAQAKLEELSRAGLRDILHFRGGDLKNAISLGMFSKKENADNYSREVLKKGFLTKIQPRFLNRTHYTVKFNITRPKSVTRVLWRMIERKYSRMQFSEQSCAPIASR